MINQRRCYNGIFGIEWDGQWIEDPKRVKDTIREHFRVHFQKKLEGDVVFPSSLVEARLNLEEGEQLIRPFLEEEVREAVWECDASKSPGPDGFNFNFFKSSWDII